MPSFGIGLAGSAYSLNRGVFDSDFNMGTGADAGINGLVTQSDGKIVCAGSFSTFNGTTSQRIIRLNSNGTVDTAFTTNIGTGSSSQITAIAIQSDGKIICVGGFSTFNGATVNNIVRLNTDGTRDTAFTTNTGTGGSGIYRVAVQPDGKILLAGWFTTFNGATVNRIVRLNSDGTRDTTFTTNTGTAFNNDVYSITVQSDGKILCGGFFTAFNGTTTNKLLRLNSDGTRDTTFSTNIGTGLNNDVYSMQTQSDGKIIVGGNFTSFNGTTVNYIVRLNTDGSRDTSFPTNLSTHGANAFINEVKIQSNDQIVVGGRFSVFNNISVNRITRLNADCTTDTGFSTNIGTGFNNDVEAVAIQSDGKIIIGGIFTTFNSVSRSRLVRIGGE